MSDPIIATAGPVPIVVEHDPGESSYELAAGAAGLQLGIVTSSGTSVDFASAAAWELDLWDPVADAFAETVVPNDWGAATQTPAGEDLVLRWESGAGDFVELLIAGPDAVGEVHITPTAWLSPATRATRSIYGLAVRLKWQRTSADRVVFPGYSTFSLPDPANYPGADLFAGFPTGATYRDWQFFGGSMPYVHAYDDETRQGFIVRAVGSDPRLKVFRLTPGGDGTTVSVITIPPANRTTAYDWQCPYSIAVRAFHGEWWDSARHHRARLVAEGNPLLQRPTRESLADGAVESVMLQLDFIGAHADIDWSKGVEEFRRLAAFFGASTILLWITNWHRHQQGVYWPQIFPPNDDFASRMAEITAEGGLPVLYTNPGPVNPITSEYLASSPAWSGLVGRQPDGTPYPHSLPAGDPPGPPANDAHILHLAREEARAAVRSHWDPILTNVPAARGWYADTYPTTRDDGDYSTDLPEAEKGHGSGTLSPGIRTYLEEQNAHFRAAVPEFLRLSEGFNEEKADCFDFMSIRTVDLENLFTVFLPAEQVVFSQHIRTNTFGVPSMGLLPGPGLTDLFVWNVALNFLRGTVATVPSLLSLPGEYLIPDEGEAAYTGRWTYEAAPYETWRDWYVATRQHLGPFFRGELLRPLPGDWLRDAMESGFKFTGTGLDDIRPDCKPVMTAVWARGAGTTREIAVLLGNWTEAEDSFEVEMHPGDYPDLWGSHTLELFDPVTGLGTSDQVFVDSFSALVTVPPRSLRALRIRPSIFTGGGDASPMPDPGPDLTYAITDEAGNVLTDEAGNPVTLEP